MMNLRLHPLSLLVSLIHLGYIYGPLFLCFYAFDVSPWLTWCVGGVVIVQVWRAYAHVRSFELKLSDGYVTLCSGRLVRRERRFPLSSVVEVEILHPFPARLLGLAEVTLDTRHQEEGASTLRYVGRLEAERLQATFGRSKFEAAVFSKRFSLYQTFISGFATQASFAVWAVLWFGATHFTRETSVEQRQAQYAQFGRLLFRWLDDPWILVVLSGLVLATAAFFAACLWSGLISIAHLHPLSVMVTTNGDVDRRQGWFKRRRFRLTRESLHAIVVERSWLLRVAGGWRVRAVVLSAARASAGSSFPAVVSGQLLCPFLNEVELKAFLRAVLGADAQAVTQRRGLPSSWRAATGAAVGAPWLAWSLTMDVLLGVWWFTLGFILAAPVGWWWLGRVAALSGFFIGADCFMVRREGVASRMVFVPWRGVTTYAVMASPLERWFGLCTVRLGTAAPVSLQVRYLPPAVWRPVLDACASAVRRVGGL